MFDENPDVPHDRDDPAAYFEVRFDFEVTEDEDGNKDGCLAGVNVHSHNVPDKAAIDALLACARLLVLKEVREKAEHQVPDGLPDALRDMVYDTIATAYLSQQIKDESVSTVITDVITIPHDASDLL
jgi:hypothetical protein